VAGRFDVAIDAQGLLKSGLAAWLTRAPIRVGFAAGDCRERGNARFMTRHAAPAGAVHAVTKNRGLLAALGVPAGESRFEIDIPNQDEAWATAWADRHVTASSGRIAVCHPGAGHPGKRWPLDRWIALADRVTGPERCAVLVAGPEDRAAVSGAVKAMRRPAAVAAPPTVGALAALLRRADVVIAGDTGPLHLAAALGRRTIALYGPSDPATAAPVGSGHRVIKHPCSCGWVPGPTFNRRCATDFACMEAITVEEVEKRLVAHS
jgi:heptosyltransferase-1